MTRLGERGRIRVQATHHYVEDPEAAATLDVWVRLLVEALRRPQPARPLTPGEPPDESAILPD
ncbi:MAG: hypothetical protein ACOY93_23590 [Bacillota bacterium]